MIPPPAPPTARIQHITLYVDTIVFKDYTGSV